MVHNGEVRRGFLAILSPMFFLYKFISNIITVLHSEESPRQLAAGFTVGALVGLLPIKGLLPLVITLGSFLININLGFLAIGTLIFKFLTIVLDPVSNQLGLTLLTKVPSLEPLWIKLYNMPIVPYTRFNNTLVLGSLALGLILLIPNYFLGKFLVAQYRSHLKDKIEQFKIIKMIKANTWYQRIQKVRDLTSSNQ